MYSSTVALTKLFVAVKQFRSIVSKHYAIGKELQLTVIPFIRNGIVFRNSTQYVCTIAADAFCSHTAVASYYAASINASNEFWAHGVLHEYSEPEFYLVGEYANTRL